jgi:single-stranded DNA-binding protein
LGNDSRPAILKAIAWGKLGQEVSEKYRAGDCIIIEGRLSMNVIERREGFKEKRAELTASKIYSLEFDGQDLSQNRVSNRDYAPASRPTQEEQNYNTNVVSLADRRPTTGTQAVRDDGDEFASEDDSFSASGNMGASASASQEDEGADDYDPIPF